MENERHRDEAATSVWPPPPTLAPPDATPFPERLDVERHLKRARMFLILSFLLFAFLQAFTIYHGFQANRKGGRGEGTGYIVVAACHLVVVVVVLLYAVLSP